MARQKQPATATAGTTFPAAETVDIAQLVEDLDAMLTRLRLGAIREQLDALLEEAARRELNLREALAWLCAAEVASKEQRRLSMAMTIAHFPFVRTLEGIEFEAQPSNDPSNIRDLPTSRWEANGDNVVLLGPPGVGKTHLEVALGREVVARGYTVQFTTAMELLGSLVKGQQQGTLDLRLAQYSKPKLLIIDELGFVPFDRVGGELLFNLLADRYERRATVVTTNLAFAEWVTVFGGDEKLTTALLDRLAHHATVITTKGKSYRMKRRRSSAA